MKYHTLAILHILIFFNPAYTYADTYFGNNLISTNTILLKNKSPYVFNENITVAPSTTLTIEQGVTLIFNQGSLFVNRGTLIGTGFNIVSKQQNYNFLIQCNSCSMDINTVTVNGIPRSVVSAWNGSTVKIDTINIDFNAPSQNTVGIQVFNNTVLNVSNSSFTRLTKAFDVFSFSTTSITNSFFTYNNHAIYTFDSDVDVHESDFEYNHIAIEFFANLEVFPVVDAHNNWWGKGNPPPVYRDDISQVKPEDINALVGVVIYDPWSLESHKRKDIATGTSNVLFLPGLMGSRLYKKDIFENQLWEPNRNSDVKKLFLDATGKSILSNVYTRDIISKTNITQGILDQAIYKDFTVYMDALVKTKIINTWKAAPYDWRYSPDTILTQGIVTGDGKNNTTMNLVAEVVLLAKNSKSKKVTIITHSNGGLVGKQLMIELKKQKLDTLVDKIIFVAMPEYGTPQAVTSLLYGHEQSIAGGLILHAATAQDLGINMPSAYTLLPSSMYFTDGKSVPIDGVELKNTLDLYSVLKAKGNINQDLLAKAGTLREAIDTWQPSSSTVVYQIVGTGLLTVSGIMKDSTGKSLPLYSSSGDGSVQDMYSITNAKFNRTGKIFITDLHGSKFKHTSIMNFTGTMKYIDLILRKNTQEATYIPSGNYPVYPDVFTLFTLSASTTVLPQKTIHMKKETGKDTLNHNPIYQFDFSSVQNSESRFDLFDKNIQYVTQGVVEELKITDSKNDIFNLQIYTKSVEGIKEVMYEDIQLFQDSVLSLDMTETNPNSYIEIGLPLLHKKLQILPTSSGSNTAPTQDLVSKITAIKNGIQTSNITGYIKNRYIRRLDVIQKKNDESAYVSLRKSIEAGIQAIDTFANNQILRRKYARLKQEYVYIVHLLK